MEDNSFEQKVRNINWAKYLEPEYYDPNKMYFYPDKLIKTLIELSQSDELSNSLGFQDETLFALGNNHGGNYYPAALEAIDLIIEIERHHKNENSRKCARAILNNLYYFQLELGSDDKNLHDLIENSVRERLKPYSDENYEI